MCSPVTRRRVPATSSFMSRKAAPRAIGGSWEPSSISVIDPSRDDQQSRARIVVPLRRDDALQFRQTPVEKMAAVLEHDDRQMLRPRPCKHVGERYDVVFFAVNDDRVGRHALGRKAI